MVVRAAQFAGGIALIILIVWGLDVPIAFLGEIGFKNWSLLFALSFCMLVFLTVQFKVTLSSVGLCLSWPDSFFLTASNSLFNLILPFKAGLLLRAAYMKKYYQVSLSDYSILMVFSQLFSLMCVCLVLFAVAYFDVRVERLAREFSEWNIVVYVMAGLFASLVVLLVLRGVKAARDVSFGLNWFLGIAFVSSIFVIFSGFRLMLSASAVTGADVGYTSVYFLLACFSSASLVFSLTPGNLGVREGLLVAAGTLLGVSVEEVVQVALVDRLASSLMIVVFGVLSTLRLARKMKVEGGV